MILKKFLIFIISSLIVVTIYAANELNKIKEIELLQQNFKKAFEQGNENRIKELVDDIVKKELIRILFDETKEIVKKNQENYKDLVAIYFDLVNHGKIEELQNIITDVSSKGLINAANRFGSNALMVACGKGYVDVVKLLIDYGANINSQNNAGKTPFEFALSIKNKDLRKNVINELISKPDFDVNNKNKFGLTPLILAVGLPQNIEIVKNLLKLNPNICAKDNNGVTALQWAVYLNNLPAIRILVKAGSDIFIKGKFTDFAKGIPKCVKRLSPEIIKFFDEYANQLNEIFNAIEKGDLARVKELLKVINVNSKNEFGMALIDVAEKNGQTEMVKFLSKQIQK